MKRTPELRPQRAQKMSATTHRQSRGFWDDLKEIAVPTNRWHYAFHAVVIAVALTYWVGSALNLKGSSWAEFVLYRPQGDNQVWPVITALSHLNFGDPTDALKYGEGIGGFHAVILLPHAIAYALFGARGYMITDAVYAWCYFIAAAMLFRRWGLGRLSSIVLSSAIATGSLQTLLQKPALAFAKFMGLCFKHGVAEWDFPDLVNMTLASKRIPRPFPTEILLVLILYFLVRQWQEPRAPSFKRGLAIGVLMGILAQGDPYSFSALGLLCFFVFVRTMWCRKWNVPWRFVGGALGGALVAGWYLVVQITHQQSDSAVRFGLATYARSKIHLLPGYGPWIRLLVIVCGVTLILALTARRRRWLAESAGSSRNSIETASASPGDWRIGSDPNTWFALFAFAMVFSAWLAQPAQLLLLGKGAEIYHYFLFILPTFYAYGFILLLIRFFKIINAQDENEAPHWMRPVTTVMCCIALPWMFVLGIEESTDAMRSQTVSRRDVTPWLSVGEAFRPSLRGLEKQFRENPDFKSARTFGTFCQEVNYLLTAFYEKRAYLPDNGYSTLSDKELEHRLCEMAKLCQLRPDQFGEMIQDTYTMNFWLGCAKYWCASDYKFAPDSDYPQSTLDVVRGLPPESAFNLAMPLSELARLKSTYETVLKTPSDVKTYPDLMILSLLLKQGVSIDKALYREIYTNNVFTVYKKVSFGG